MHAPATLTHRLPWTSALAGFLAAGVAIALSELVAGLITGVPALVTAVGSLVISLQPPGAKDVMVALFGTNDKLALNVIVVLLALAAGATAGVIAARRFEAGAAIFVGFGIVAGVAAARDPLASPVVGIAIATVAVGAGLITLRWLLRLAPSAPGEVGAMRPDHETAPPGDEAASPRDDAPQPHDDPALTRRRFLIASAGTLGGVIVVGAAGRTLVDAHHVEGVVSTSTLPRPLVPVPPLAADQSLDLAGLTPIVVPNDRFYRIDTALLVPQVDVETWQLKVTGMVDHALTFTYDELLGMPLYEQYVTIACVSNEVGGGLVGNALWTGVRLKDVLEAAGIQPGASQIVGRSVEGFTVGFPTEWATAPEREPMIAVGMNREPLPAGHGYPARLVVPGLYGYVSATKWLAEIELTTREAIDGYWVPLGWAKDAPILTQARIDVPGSGERLSAGPVGIGGVAWAPDRGIAGVEVRIDEGTWQPARISRPISDATWVQWTLPWSAEAGRHSIEVRATDSTGVVQTADQTQPAPDGARGHHRIFVQVG